MKLLSTLIKHFKALCKQGVSGTNAEHCCITVIPIITVGNILLFVTKVTGAFLKMLTELYIVILIIEIK